ncbi:hypothetical protein [Croceicoccus marinus]|jgi:hypothetical protein|uniref:DUF2306 domain-containing protein n=1 Tax=Croceicoccus marinus TaxID=450378 RepID=A0A7G6VUR1_9SPHN|nr:hypothetical protein [Croceicoccus marinus]QNE05476.1 hypothetical protein H4O24_01885 [Croceicoccus marinus]
MATSPITQGAPKTTEGAERRFHLYLAIAMSATIVAGFSVHLAMGRSTFAVPPIFHVHALVFFGWVALYLAQTALIAGNNARLHRTLGLIAFAWIPLMVVVGIALSLTVSQRTGGPFFFDKNQFLFSNTAHLLAFAGLAFASLKVRRHGGWHRRLMLVAFAILTGPGLGRLFPLPLLIPHAWHFMLGVVLVWPAIGMIRDRMVMGRIHPAWLWGIGAVLAAQLVADLIAYSHWGLALTEQYTAGTPGGERPMEAFIPPGFAL